MSISHRISQFQLSPIRKLTPYAEAAKKKGIHVYHLNIGQPDIQTPQEAFDAIANIDSKIIAYGPSEGTSDLRRAFADYYHRVGVPSIEPEDILITTGGSEALEFLFMTLCDEGDEALIIEPYYTNVGTFAQMAGVKLKAITSTLSEGFRLPPVEHFEDAITPKTRMIMLNSPNNPTGYTYTHEELLILLRICAKYEITLVVDEVYREFCYDGVQFSSSLAIEEYSDYVVCVDSFSKRFSMCGARVGAIVTKNHLILEQALKLGQARLCPPALGQIAATAAFNAPASYIEDVQKMYESRRNCIIAELEKIPHVKFCKPNGAFYLIVSLPVHDAEDFCTFMLRDFSYNNATVMMAPAGGFYVHAELGRKQVRIAYVLKEEDLIAAMECLKRGLEAYKNKKLSC